MKLFTKLALVSAMAVSGSAMALQSMDDAALSATTGQDGITVQLHSEGIDIAKVIVHDEDGLDYTNASWTGNFGTTAPVAGEPGFGGTAEAGGIVINGISVTTTSADNKLATLIIDTDAGANDDPFLNVGVVTGDINIKVDSIAVGSSNSGMTNLRRGVSNETKILSGYTDTDKIDVTVGGSNLNIQLGNTPQGAMIIASGTVTGGLTVNNLAVVDAAGGGAIGIDKIRVTDASSANLTASAKIGVTPDGLKVDLGDLAQDIYIDAVRFGSAAGIGTAASTIGSAASIGAVEINGLTMNNTSLTVSGH